MNECYDCEFRGGCVGSCHSCCEHPSIEKSSVGELMGLLGSVGRVPCVIAPNKLEIKADAHGIRNGWFNWPYNFDPTWLTNCNGFKKKGDSNEKVTTNPEGIRSKSCSKSNSKPQ